MTNIIFLDVDGVLNCELFYHSQQFTDFKSAKKQLKKDVKSKKIETLDYYASQICRDRIGWLNQLCAETDSMVVLSASMRSQWDVPSLQKIFNYCGATFIIIDKTPHCDCRNRGCEIHKWLQDNTEKYFGIKYYDFYRYAIIDDDSDMLLRQQPHFFQTDPYSGLTPTTCYKIKRFFTHKTF